MRPSRVAAVACGAAALVAAGAFALTQVWLGASDNPSGLGVDPKSDGTCMVCHGVAYVGQWPGGASHRLLTGCVGCHALSKPAGAGHASLPACDSCHSEVAHPKGSACTACHDPHGSPNAFLVRPQITLPSGAKASIHLTKPQGASADGLTHPGSSTNQTGAGLCEACHTKTAYYNATGTAKPHETAWCGTCHDHAGGFASPEP